MRWPKTHKPLDINLMKLLSLLLAVTLCSCGRTDSSPLIVPAHEEINDCVFEDGSHSATVRYYNPNTGFKNTYELEVDVSDCEIIRINFPKGGWLDEDHIQPTEIDEDGEATIEDDQGRIWEIQLN